MEVADQAYAPRTRPSAAIPAPMKLAFDMDAVEKWAQFSSDRNPIHFELAHARLAGLDALIVHGMLALMPVKDAVAGAIEPGGWMKFKSLLRNPIPHGAPIAFDAKPAAEGLSFQVRGSAGQIEHFRGTYRRAEDPVAELQGARLQPCRALRAILSGRAAALDWPRRGHLFRVHAHQAADRRGYRASPSAGLGRRCTHFQGRRAVEPFRHLRRGLLRRARRPGCLDRIQSRHAHARNDREQQSTERYRFTAGHVARPSRHAGRAWTGVQVWHAQFQLIIKGLK
jgi:hypothetical protein